MKYDVVVIGSGSAGAVVATRLSEDPDRSVILLEAGPDYAELDLLPPEVRNGFAPEADVITGQHNWGFVGRSTDKAGPMIVPRGKVTGGSSAVNDQIFLRGVPEDYDVWASLGNDLWSFEEVQPFFRKLETDTDFSDDLHGTGGPIIARRFKPEEWLPAQSAFYNACRAAGYPDVPDHNHPDSFGVGPMPMNNPNGIRFSTNLGYLSRARHRPNLTIRGLCAARRILFAGERATGVEVESGGERFVVKGQEIVLSAGAIGSPHLLMLSGVGPEDQLRSLDITVVRDLQGVGRNLRDHPTVAVKWWAKGEFAKEGTIPRFQVGLRYTAPRSSLRNDMRISMNSLPIERVDTEGNRMAPLGIHMGTGIQLAIGSGELRLTSKDPKTQPFLDYNYLQDPFDRQRHRDAVHLCIRLGGHEDFNGILGERIEPTEADLASDEALDDWLLRNVSTSHHISGTCKMGPASDPLAVVDQYGWVHGLEGLRVVDASIMPDCIRANTNVTTMMIGERIADFMRHGL